MSKVRVYELARELNIETKVLLSKLKSAGIKVQSHQSTLTDQQVAELRQTLGASLVGATATKASEGEPKPAKPKVVIRRRAAATAARPAAAEAETTAAPVEAPKEQETAAAPAESETPVAAEAPAVETPQAPAEEPAPQVAAHAEEEPARVEEKAVEAEPATPEVKAPAATPAPTEVTRRRREAGGATIVRRATPEEVEKIQSQNMQRQAGRKEDHRGTRVTGSGLLSNRISGRGDGELPPLPQAGGAATDESAAWGDRRPVGLRDRKTADEEEIARKKAAAKKSRSGGPLNMRALLEQAEILTSDDDVIKTDYHGRTVYTPTAPRSKRDIKRRKDLKKTQITTPRAAYRVVEMGEAITVGELSRQLAVKSAELIKKLMAQGVMATINQSIDVDTATLLAADYGFDVKSTVQTVEDIIKAPTIDETKLETRSPIVTVMGHVDHGKTSILDAIREANVAAGEAGGITQHIGAYSVERNGKKITFLDTPGHEAFSAMRARGAKVTDIVVLVVAADDGVMPQTVEAISHAKDAGVPIIVAVNKIDKPNVNFDRIYTELTEHGVQAEDWGGDTQFIKCSALQRKGIDDLLEAILLQAEVLDLKSTSDGPAEGVVIEAHLDKGRGPVATVVVERGTLRVGDHLVAGTEVGRVRAMADHRGREQRSAGPADPVEIIGLSGVPMAGDKVNVVADEKTARDAADWRIEQARKAAAGKSSAASLEDLLARVQTEEALEVPIIIKADTQGTVEAISETIMKLNTPRVKNRIVHSGVGGVTESDITLAQASGAIVIGFNVRAVRGLDEVAERAGVPVRYFSIIYEIVDAVKAIMVGKLPPVVNEVVLGHAEVRKPISVPKIGTIAGSAVTDGKITRNSHCRLIRDSVVIYTGKLGSLRRFKDDVKEVVQGYECGISIDGYNDLKEGDVIEAYILEETAATL